METKIEKAENLVLEIKKRLEDPAIATNHVKLGECMKDLEVAQSKVEDLYTRWESLEARLATS